MSESNNDLPEVLEAHWDREQIDAFFNDLAAGADVSHVQVRRATEQGPQDAAVTLDEAKELLDQGVAKAVQIHYRFQEQSWCDTLFALPEAVRIVRTSGLPLR